MDNSKQIERFRHFNRFYTEYLGVFGKSLYDSPVNLTEARILYELDSRPGDSARAIMDHLGLDKGYLSRILKRFGREGWLVESPSGTDARVKELSLSPEGKDLMAVLHAQAARQAGEAMSHLAADDRKRLLSAMETIENLLSNGSVESGVGSRD